MSPADLTNPFGPSCCDGGVCSDGSKSAQPCGCDPGAGWICMGHQQGLWAERDDMGKKEYSNPLEKHLKEVVNRTWNFSGRLKTERDHTLNAIMGLAGEAGEVLDEHKKLYFHTEKDRTEAIMFELGDVCYYLAKILDIYGLKLEDVLEANRKKLFERHGIKE